MASELITGDGFTDDWANWHESGKMLARQVRELIERDGADKVADHLDILTENLYQGLPSGDYGRGDVKRVIRALVEEVRR